jgi:hypothetical protein
LEGGTTVKIVDMESQFVFITDLELATHDKTHSEFPPYARIFPTDAYATKVTFHDKDKLISVLKRHRSLSKEDTFDVSLRVDVEMQRLSMTTLNVDRLSTGDVFHEVACDMIKVEATGDAFTTTLDANRLITFLGHAVFPVTMLVPASSAVGVKRILDFHSSGGTQEEPTYRFLLLPLRSGPMMSTAAPAPEPTSVDDRVPAVIA